MGVPPPGGNIARGDSPYFILTVHPPPPEGWLDTEASNFCRRSLKNEIRRVRSLHVGTFEKFVWRVKILWASLKKNRTPPPPLPIWKPVILRGGVWIKNGMSPEQKCKWSIKVELEHETLARVTFIFSGSHKKFFLVFLQMIYYILSPWKM